MNKILLLFTFQIILIININAQKDSLVFSYDEYIENVLFHHPIFKQSDLQKEKANANLLKARGNFDPEFLSSWSQKNLNDKLYYRKIESTVNIPTPIGVDIVGGYENIQGDFVNPEVLTNNFGLWNIGLEANLIQGLLIDERRTSIKQAKVYENIVENQAQILLNQLIYDASLAYLNWQEVFSIQKILMENVEIASTYLKNTIESFEAGEKTVVDTLEAALLLQDRKILLEKNKIYLVKSQTQLENYLWFEQVPLELKETQIPQDLSVPVMKINDIINNQNNIVNNPIIQEKQNKLFFYQLEQRWKREKLKPKLKIKYNPLLYTNNNALPIPAFDNFRWGMSFSMPLLFREEKAEVLLGEIKLKEIELDIQNKQNELLNKIEFSWEQQNLLNNQIQLQENNLLGYKNLLDAEKLKFDFGESSVFLLNKRQEKYIENQVKVIQLKILLQKEILNYLFLTNQLI